jgi:hypothetical protein
MQNRKVGGYTSGLEFAAFKIKTFNHAAAVIGIYSLEKQAIF